jgi:hypothetical protein
MISIAYILFQGSGNKGFKRIFCYICWSHPAKLDQDSEV